MEDYLEAIVVLRDERQVVRVSHIAEVLSVSTPSVTSALKRLREEGMVAHEPYGHVELTAEGESIARDVLQTHHALRSFLTEILGVEPDVAAGDACKMEHSVSPSTRARLFKFVDFVLSNPRGRPDWIENFNYYVEHGGIPEQCRDRCHRN